MVSDSVQKTMKLREERAEKRRLERIDRDQKERMRPKTEKQVKKAKRSYDKGRYKVKHAEVVMERECSLTDTELAFAQNQLDGGRALQSVAKSLGTVGKPLKKRLMHTDFNTPEMKELCKMLKETEIDRLMVLGEKARQVVDDDINKMLLGEKEPKNLIPLIATMDRSFQQRRLLEGESTSNIQIYEQVMHKFIKDKD